MSSDVIQAIAAIFAGITGVAIIAVLVSRNSNTSEVIRSAGSAYGSSLAVALSPITGGGSNNNRLDFGTQF